jgi:uncharacterized protein (TIGR02996 family)
MSGHQAFQAEIIANPDDDGARLVYADWLEDNGDPNRAEFIRAQIRLASWPGWDPERFDLAGVASTHLEGRTGSFAIIAHKSRRQTPHA